MKNALNAVTAILIILFFGWQLCRTCCETECETTKCSSEETDEFGRNKAEMEEFMEKLQNSIDSMERFELVFYEYDSSSIDGVQFQYGVTETIDTHDTLVMRGYTYDMDSNLILSEHHKRFNLIDSDK